MLVTRLDQLARSTRDLLNTLDAIAKAGAGCRSNGESWANTTTAYGWLVLAVLGDLSPLANLTALRWLDLDDTQVSDPIMTSETAANEETTGSPSDLDGDLAREMSLERTETPVLTLEAIEADAWNAVAYELPEKADRALLDAAFRAVRSCVARERELMLAEEEGLHVPAGRTEGEDSAPVHAYNEARWRQARERLDLIGNRYLQELHAYNEAHRIDWDTVR